MNVIWVVSDTVRIDAISAYGNKKMHTPALDAFAEKAVRFDRYYIAGFPTMQTRADHMTGRWTVSFMQWEPIPSEQPTLAEIITPNGIDTAAIVDTPFYIRNGMNYDRGFRTFEEVPGQLWTARGDPSRNPGYGSRSIQTIETNCCAPRTFSGAMEWLDTHYKNNFFLYIDVWDPHEPWTAPDYYTSLYWSGYDGELMRELYGYWKEAPGFTEEYVNKAHAAYCGEVTMVDTWFGYLMRKVENMGLLENTAVIFTTDHGYYFGEHGSLYGKMVFDKEPGPGSTKMGAWARSPMYEEVAHIPLIIYMPDIPSGRRNSLVSAIDLMPTVMEMLGQDIPSTVEGKSIVPILQDASVPGREIVFSSPTIANPGDTDQSVDAVRRYASKPSMATITTSEWSLLYDVEPGGSELYNLKSDPKQENNLISQNPEVARELHQAYVNHLRETNLDKRLLDPRLEIKL
jgi:arylsulfatase A-like enzyme